VIRKLHDEIVAALAKPVVKDRFNKQGAEVVTDTPEQFGATIKSETARWAEIIKKSGAHID
jgi:tripartite-type tricarboxylate transporter receptor subunit TctC